jgi:site-specific recombinase XerD
LVERYVEEYQARGISPQTVEHVHARLVNWGAWLKLRKPRVAIEQIDTALITRYIASRSSFRAKSTVYGALSTMRGFGDFLVREGLWSINPMRWMRGPKITPYSRLPKRIDWAHMQVMWGEAARLHGSHSAHLWVTVLALLYGTGLRRGELERLRLAHLDRAQGTLLIDGRKTGQQRLVPLPQMVQRCLEAYLPLRHNVLERTGRVGESALLVTRLGTALLAGGISMGVHRLARRAGVGLHSLHQFRHTCASDLLQAGVHVADVQRILGHAGVATTVRYIHIADPQRHAAIALHPLNQWLTALQEAA